MTDIENREHKPDPEELCAFVGLPLFGELGDRMRTEYGALTSVEYSGDKILLGWNVKYKKGGRTLCTVYPRPGHFFLLLVIGRREKERVEALLPSLTEEFRHVYESTREGMGQRWLLFDLTARGALFEDICRIIRVRRENP